MSDEESMDLELGGDCLFEEKEVAASGSYRWRTSRRTGADGSLTNKPVEELVKALLAGGLTTTIQKIAKQHVALMVGDVSEVIASTSRRSETATDGQETGGTERRSVMWGHEVVDHFDPNDPDANVELWLHKIDQLGAIHGWTSHEKSTLAQTKLVGAAKRWFQQLEDYDLTWDQWKVKLRAAFSWRREFADMLEEMIGRYKLSAESMTTYYNAKLALCHRVKIVGEDAVSCIIQGLPAELRANARATMWSSPEVLYNSFLVKLENYHSESAPRQSEVSRIQRSARQASTSELSTSMARGQKRCYNCQQVTDHVSRDCPRPAADRCRTCGEVGHKAFNCPERRVPWRWRGEGSGTKSRREGRGIATGSAMDDRFLHRKLKVRGSSRPAREESARNHWVGDPARAV